MFKLTVLEQFDWDGNWDLNISKFIDFNYKQLSAFTSSNSFFSKYLRFILLHNDKPVVYMQAKVFTLPFGCCFIFVRGGPIFFELDDKLTNQNKLSKFFSELKIYLNEKYKFFYLNILCNTELNHEIDFVFYESGLKKPTFQRMPYFSYIVNIFDNPEINFKNFNSKWRNQLRKALSYQPTFDFGSEEKLISDFVSLYNEMHKIKLFKYEKDVSLNNFLLLQKNMKKGFNILIVRVNNVAVCGCVLYIIGSKAFYHLAASNHEGRNMLSSNAMIWFLINKLRELDVKKLDLVGIDPINNWGSYHFKKGIGGELIRYVGEWEMSSNSLIRILMNILLYTKVHFTFKKK